MTPFDPECLKSTQMTPKVRKRFRQQIESDQHSVKLSILNLQPVKTLFLVIRALDITSLKTKISSLLSHIQLEQNQLFKTYKTKKIVLVQYYQFLTI